MSTGRPSDRLRRRRPTSPARRKTSSSATRSSATASPRASSTGPSASRSSSASSRACPIWTPVFGWMATLVGGLSVCRVVHPWFGLAFALASLAMAVHWWAEMKMTEARSAAGSARSSSSTCATPRTTTRSASTTAARRSTSTRRSSARSGSSCRASSCGSRRRSRPGSAQIAVLLHDVTFILFAVSLVFHIYLAARGRARDVELDDPGHRLEGVGAHPPPEVVPRAHGAREVTPRRQEGFVRGGAPALPFRFPAFRR